LNISIPPNTAATVFVPFKTAGSATATAGATWLRDENGCAVFAAGAGNATFQSQF
jgi:hypothetical protein